MNWVRVGTGIVIFFITSLILYTGGFIFTLSVTAVGLVALWEFYRLTICNVTNTKNLLLLLSGFLHTIVLFLVTYMYGSMYVSLILSCNIVTISLISIFLYKDNLNIPTILTKQIAGLVYIPVSLSFLVIMRNGEYGLFWSLMIIFIIASGDIGAYYCGSFLGKYKLCPHISPKKTVEGFLGGLLCSVLVVITFRFCLFPFISIFSCIFLACAVGIVGQVGDLFASEFKREAGVKDYGKILPGHGGFLDRIDALLLALPVAYLFYCNMII